MLDREAMEGIQKIKKLANQVWGSNVKFGEWRAIESPYPEFEWPIKLYGYVDARFEYDRSTVGIYIKKPEGYVGINMLTDEYIYRGLKSGKPENLLHNMKVLDNLVKQREI